MCGRFSLTAEPEEVQALFDLFDVDPFPPRFNIAPTQPVGAICSHPEGRRFTLFRWGFIPSWVKDPGSFSLLINARSETAFEKPAFRSAMRRRRCLIPASGFYEWQRGAKSKVPYWVHPRNGGLVAFGGTWETWSGSDGSEVDTLCILTTAANAALARIHHRMPVTITPDRFAAWLSPDEAVGAIQDLMAPVPDDHYSAYPVSDRVNAARTDDPSLQDRVDSPGAAQDAAEDKDEKTANGPDQLTLL